MTGPGEKMARDTVTELTGPRYQAGAYPLLQLAKDAVHGHAAIAEKVKEHAELVAAERETQRAARDAESHAETPAIGSAP